MIYLGPVMSTLKRAVPVVERAYKSCGSKSFHASSGLAAKARPSPKIAQKPGKTYKAPAPGTVVQVRKTLNLEDALPPITLLNPGSKSGALDIPPEKALNLLRQYQVLAQKSTTGWEQKLCDDHDVSPSTLYLLAQILNRCPSNAQRSLAKKLMQTASSLGSNTATYEIINSALRKESLNLEEYTAPLRRLGILAKQEQDHQAMALLGKIMLSLGKEIDALEWFRKSTSSGLDFDGASEVLVQEGGILLTRQDKEGARTAFTKAALELDDPSAFFYLSQLQPRGSPQQEVYLLKAASSGIVEASHNLGALEMERVKERPKGVKSIHDFDVAREWFEVAAAEGFGLSMLNLAMIYKAGGQIGRGEKWLVKAEQLPEIKDDARRVRSQWGGQKVEIL